MCPWFESFDPASLHVILLSLGETFLREVLISVPRDDENGSEALEIAFLILPPFAWTSFGRLRAHATMNPRDTSASVHKPRKRPLWETSASEMTGVILTVNTIRIVEATQALTRLATPGI
jgi:hypothetical protein